MPPTIRPRSLRHRALLAVALGLLGWVAPAMAAASAEPPSLSSDRINFRRFSPRDGLPSAVVYCGMEDSRGFLWFGTADGVARFDGNRFRVFRPDPRDPDSLANGAVLGIHEDPAGNLWMATEGGLALWHRDTERFSHFRHDPANPSSLSENTTQSLVADPDGTLWVGTTRGGLNHFDPRTGKVERFLPARQRDDTVNDAWIRCLFVDREGVLWIGTGSGGLNRFDRTTRRFRVYAHDPANPRSLPDNRVSRIAEDAAGNLWVATDNGVCRFGADRSDCERILTGPDSSARLPVRAVNDLIVEASGRIGIATDGGGYSRYDPNTRKVTHHFYSPYVSNTIATDKVRTVFEDRHGDLWLGHFPAGVSHFDHSTAAFQVFSRVPGAPSTLSDDQVLSFLEDPSGDLWVGTDNGGLNHWTAATGMWRSYRHDPDDPHSLGGNAVISVLRDHRGQLWATTWEGGLSRLDEASGTFRHYQPPADEGRAPGDVHAWRMLEDRDHRLWISIIGGGLARYVPETDSLISFRHDPSNPRSLNDNIVCAMLLTRAGALWVGTAKGLARWSPATQDWDRFTNTTDTLGNNPWTFDLLEDREGMIWCSTESDGLHRLNPLTGEWRRYRTPEGLPSDNLRGLLQDDDGMLWIGSNRGLVRFNPRSQQVDVFDENHGLPDSQFNPHARLRLASGEFLFGTTHGFVRFAPRAILTHTAPIPIVLTSFEAFNETVPPARPGSPLRQSITETRRLEIPASYSVISFQFTALGFPSPKPEQYRFMLEGFDQAWRTPGRELRATFTNLDPGRYRLRVRTARGDGTWNETGFGLELIVIPPWWATWWFRTGGVACVLGAAAAAGWGISAHRQRTRTRERELAQERLRNEERAQAAEALRVLNQELEQRVADRTAKLVAVVQELEAFSYSVSHDLRTPLRSIDGFSRVLLDDYADRLDADGKDSLHRIRAASQRMGHLIDDLLKLAQVSRGEMSYAPIDLSAMARTVAEELRRGMPERHLEFTIAPNLVAAGDARLLQIVLENLLGNAVKFSARRPVARIELGLGERGGTPAFFVRDNGAGFDVAAAPKLFGAFQRFHTSAEFPGTGIGLATVQRIVHRHGGRLEAESRPDHGATFWFTLPPQPHPIP